MRRFLLFLAALLLAAPIRAQEDDEGVETIVDKRSGLRIAMPLGWAREDAREKGSVRFAAMYDLSRDRYVLFTVESGSAMGFDEASWLDNEKASAAKFLKSIDTPWSTEAVTVGGEKATRYTIGGKANAEQDYNLRVRACGVVNGDTFFRIMELSFNKVHEDEDVASAIDTMWKAVSFQEADPFAEEGEEDGGGVAGGADTPAGEPVVIDDTEGNFKITAPPGWSIERAPPDDEEGQLRVVLMRRSPEGDDLAGLEIFRIRWGNSETFVLEEPGDFLLNQVTKDMAFFEPYYEEGSGRIIRPQVDVRTQLGGAEKSCSYEIRARRLSEDAKIEEAQKLIDRGDPNAKLPVIPELVIRGRMAMISPHIYIARCIFLRRDMSDNEKLVDEYRSIMDSWEFESTKAKPPQLQGKDGPLGDTRADPANKEDRKISREIEAKAGTKVLATLKLSYVVPAGFQEADVVQGRAVSEEWPLQIVAQDENNGWVTIRMYAKHQRTLPPRTVFDDKKQVFETWISNFESRARGTGKMPKKPEKVRIGNLSGEGCELEGKIDKFHASEVDLVTDTSGWRIIVEIETRGTGATTFEEGIKTFRKRLRASKK